MARSAPRATELRRLGRLGGDGADRRNEQQRGELGGKRSVAQQVQGRHSVLLVGAPGVGTDRTIRFVKERRAKRVRGPCERPVKERPHVRHMPNGRAV